MSPASTADWGGALGAQYPQVNGSPRCAECGAVLDVEECIETFGGFIVCSQCHDFPAPKEQHDE